MVSGRSSIIHARDGVGTLRLLHQITIFAFINRHAGSKDSVTIALHEQKVQHPDLQDKSRVVEPNRPRMVQPAGDGA